MSNTNEEIDPYIPNTERNCDVNMPIVKLAGDVNNKGKEVSLLVTGQYPVIDGVENNLNLRYTTSPNKNETSPSAHIFPYLIWISMLISPAQIAYCIQIVHAHTMLMLPITYYPIMFIVVASDAFVALKEIRCKNFNRVIFGHLNINSIRNKMEMLTQLIIGKIDILLISETKIDNSFPSKQFL